MEHFFRGTLKIYTLSEEVPWYRVNDGIEINCVAREIRSSQKEDSPEVPQDADVV